MVCQIALMLSVVHLYDMQFIYVYCIFLYTWFLLFVLMASLALPSHSTISAQHVGPGGPPEKGDNSSWLMVCWRVDRNFMPREGRSRSVDVGELSRSGAIVVYRAMPHMPHRENFEAAVKRSLTFGPLLTDLAAHAKFQRQLAAMLDHGTVCPQLILVPPKMFSSLKALLCSDQVFLCSDILVSLELDLEFRRLLDSFPDMSWKIQDLFSNCRSQCYRSSWPRAQRLA